MAMMLINLNDGLMISGWSSSVLALFIGVLLGVFYFLGLWWTVRQLNSSQNIAPVFLLSMLFRTAVVVLGFYILLGNDWQQLLLGLIGFMLVRFFATRYVSNMTLDASHLLEKKSDAS
jgi:F1F0 ATPase subunit 2